MSGPNGKCDRGNRYCQTTPCREKHGSCQGDGASFDLIHVPGIGFSRQPYIDAAQFEVGLCEPQMNGMELFRQVVRAMPPAVFSQVISSHSRRSVLAPTGARPCTGRRDGSGVEDREIRHEPSGRKPWRWEASAGFSPGTSLRRRHG